MPNPLVVPALQEELRRSFLSLTAKNAGIKNHQCAAPSPLPLEVVDFFPNKDAKERSSFWGSQSTISLEPTGPPALDVKEFGGCMF